jgi:hypothetical protein
MKFFICNLLVAILTLEAALASATPPGAASAETRPAYRIEIVLRITQIQQLSGIPTSSRVAEPPRAHPDPASGSRVRRLDPINQTVLDVVRAAHRIGMALLHIWLDQWTGAAPRTVQPPQR